MQTYVYESCTIQYTIEARETAQDEWIVMNTHYRIHLVSVRNNFLYCVLCYEIGAEWWCCLDWLKVVISILSIHFHFHLLSCGSFTAFVLSFSLLLCCLLFAFVQKIQAAFLCLFSANTKHGQWLCIQLHAVCWFFFYWMTIACKPIAVPKEMTWFIC